MRIFFGVMLFCSTAICASAKTIYTEAKTATNSVLSLQQALQNTLENNPDLVAYAWQFKALAGEAETAALKPAYRLGVDLENAAGSGEYRGTDAAEWTVSLSSVIEFADQRATRTGLVTARQQQLESGRRLLMLDLLADVTRQFILQLQRQEQLALRKQAVDLQQQTIHSLKSQLLAGRISEVELLRAEATLGLGKIDIESIQQQLAGERLKLAAFWGQSQPDFVEVQANLFFFSELPSSSELSARLLQNPDRLLLAEEVKVQSANLRQAQAQSRSAVEWSAGVRRLQSSDDTALVVGVNVPLGNSARASGAIKTANALQAHAEMREQQAGPLLESRLQQLLGFRKQSIAEANRLQQDIIPKLKKAVQLSFDAFRAGRNSYQQLNQVQQELLDAQSRLITAAAHAQLANVDIDRLLGISPINSQESQP